MPESVQWCFELSIHFPVFFSHELFLVAVHDWFAIQTNVWKGQGRSMVIFRNCTQCQKVIYTVLALSPLITQAITLFYVCLETDLCTCKIKGLP